MKTSTALNLFAITTICLAAHQPAQAQAQPLTGSALAFVQHPQNCLYFTGAAGHRGEDLSLAYSVAAAEAINQLTTNDGKVDGAISALDSACKNKLATQQPMKPAGK